MPTIAELVAELRVDDSKFQKGMQRATSVLKGLGERAASLPSVFSRMRGGMDSAAQGANGLSKALGAMAKASLVLGAIDLGRRAVETATKFEGYRKSLEATLGSQQRVAAEMRDLKEIAKLPGIGLEESIQSFQRFVAVGTDTKLAKGLISGLGKLNAISGGTVDNFNEAARQFSQIQSAGRITEENLGVIKERLPAFAKAMRDTFGTTTAEGLKAAGIGVDTFVQKMAQAMDATKGVSQTAQNSWDNFEAASTDALNSLGQLLLPMAVKGADLLSSALTTLSDGMTAFAASPIGNAIIASIGAAFQNVGDIVLSVGSTVAGALESIGVSVSSSDIQTGIRTFTEGFRAATERVEAFVKSPAFRQGMQSFVQGLRTAWDAARPVFSFLIEQGTAVVSWFQGNWPLISRTVGTVLTTIQQLWQRHGSQIMAILGPLWDQVKLTVSSGLKIIGGLVKTVLQVINGDWRGAWTSFSGVVGTAWQFIKGTLGNIGQMLSGALRLVIDTIADLGARFLSAARGIGSAILDGIVSAVRGGYGRVVDAVTGLGQSAISGIKRALGIASPSREFAKVGRFSVDGMVLGMLSNLGMIEAAGEKMGQAAVKGSKKRNPKTEGQRQGEAFVKVFAAARAELAALQAGGSDAAAKLASRFALVAASRRAELASIQESIKGLREERRERERLAESIQSAKQGTRDAAQDLLGGRAFPGNAAAFTDAATWEALSTRLNNLQSASQSMRDSIRSANIELQMADPGTSDQDRMYLRFFGMGKAALYAELASLSKSLIAMGADPKSLGAAMQQFKASADAGVNRAIQQQDNSSTTFADVLAGAFDTPEGKAWIERNQQAQEMIQGWQMDRWRGQATTWSDQIALQMFQRPLSALSEAERAQVQKLEAQRLQIRGSTTETAGGEQYASQTNQRSLSDVLTRGGSIQGAIKGFWQQFIQNGSDSLLHMGWEKILQPKLEGCFGTLTDGVNASTSGLITAAGQIVSAGYGLLSALGAMGGKRRKGGLFGGLLGGAIGFLTGGPGGALKGFQLGSSLGGAIQGGNLGEIAMAGYGAYSTLSGKNGFSFSSTSNTKTSTTETTGKSRSVVMNVQVGSINNAGDLNRVTNSLAYSVERRLAGGY